MSIFVQYGRICNYTELVSVSGNGAFTFDYYYPYLYVTDEGASNNSILKIYDLSNTDAAVLLSTTSLPNGSGAKNPRIYGDTLYIPYRNAAKIALWNVADRTVPVLFSETTVSANPNGVAVIGTTACVCYADSFVQSYTAEKLDVSNPSSPRIDANWKPFAGVSLGYQVNVAGSNFVVSGQKSSGGPVYIGIVSSGAFATVGTLSDTDNFAGTAAGANAVNSAGTVVFVEMGSGNVWSVDISTPGSPAQLDKQSVSGTTGGGPIAYNDLTKFLYVGRFSGSGLAIYIVDANDPSNLLNTGTISTSSEATTDLQCMNDYCPGLLYAQGTGAAIHLLGIAPLS